MSWERKQWEEEQKTQQLLDELGYSEGQRMADELFHGDAALDTDWAAQRRSGPHGWLLGSPYHRGLGGQVYFLMWVIGICAVIAIAAFSVRGWVAWQTARQQSPAVQSPPAATTPAAGTPSGPPVAGQ